MGLDMYLAASKYIGDWEHNNEKTRKAYQGVMAAIGFAGFRCDDCPSLDLKFNVAYWRKANAIHKWFVTHVQEGKDECQESYVTREQLAALVAACEQVLNTVETVEGMVATGTTYYGDGRVENHVKPGSVVAQPGVAAAVLPTQGGFFFGGTAYDEFYLDDLRRTVAQIKPLLTDPRFEDCSFYYTASW